jgi:hypothetical protein
MTREAEASPEGVETIAYYLERASAGIIARKKQQIARPGPLMALQAGQSADEKTPNHGEPALSA